MPQLDICDIVQETLEIVYRLGLVGVRIIIKFDMIQENHQHVFNPAKLLSIAGDVVENLFLNVWIGRFADIDVDESNLSRDRAEHRLQKAEPLLDWSRKRQIYILHDGASKCLRIRTAIHMDTALSLLTQIVEVHHRATEMMS